MEKITREVFNKWAQKCNWLKINEGATQDGRQDTFVVPSGNLMVAIYDLKGDLFQIVKLGPPPQAPPPSHLLKGLQFPGGKG